MKTKVIIFLSFILSLLQISAVFAEEPEPLPEAGLSRIPWAIKCAGGAPAAMYTALALLAVCIVISVIYYKKISGGDK